MKRQESNQEAWISILIQTCVGQHKGDYFVLGRNINSSLEL